MDKHTTGSIDYYTYGTIPRLFMVSGVHGDETEAAKLLESWVREQYHSLPPFLYIPFASPSACRLGTRNNAQGHDLNRKFRDQTDDAEVRDYKRIVEGHRFELMLDIHEDRDRTKSFYVYDSSQMETRELSSYREAMEELGVPLFTGVDDPEDETLGCTIDRGYYALHSETNEFEPDEGFSNKWMVRRGIARRTFTMEIPQLANTRTKQEIISKTIPYFIGRYIVK